MKRWSKRTLSAAMALTLLLTLAGCGAAKSLSNASASSSFPESGDQMYYDEVGWDESWNGDTPEASGTSVGTQDGSKMIYTARLVLETVEFDWTVEGIEQLAADCGGYIESSTLDGGSYRWGYYTVRVPQERFQDFCDRAGALCQLNSRSMESQNVSEQYYDTESRLTTQRTKLERLQALLAKAEQMEDIITIESAIAETELSIEQLTGTLRNYDSRIGYSTVDLTLHEVSQLSGVQTTPIGFGETLAAAFRTGSRNFVLGTQNLLLDFARGWAGWLIAIVAVVLAVLFVKKHPLRRRARMRRAPDSAAPDAAPAEDALPKEK